MLWVSPQSLANVTHPFFLSLSRRKNQASWADDVEVVPSVATAAAAAAALQAGKEFSGSFFPATLPI